METANVMVHFDNDPQPENTTARKAVEFLALSRLRIAIQDEKLQRYEDARARGIVPTDADLDVNEEMQRSAYSRATEFVRKLFPDYVVSFDVVVTQKTST